VVHPKGGGGGAIEGGRDPNLGYQGAQGRAAAKQGVAPPRAPQWGPRIKWHLHCCISYISQELFEHCTNSCVTTV